MNRWLLPLSLVLGACEQPAPATSDAACDCFPDHAIGRCVDDACTLHGCLDGFVDCDGDPANGCEIDPTTDAANCGACGAACTVAAAGSPVCAAGECGAACDPGHGDCDGNPSNGCERLVVGFTDSDHDGVGVATSWSLVCALSPGLAATSGDCDDQDARVFPGQRGRFGTPSARVGFDFDCDGQERKEPQEFGLCSGDTCRLGWLTLNVPCGGSGSAITGCSFGGGTFCTYGQPVMTCN